MDLTAIIIAAALLAPPDWLGETASVPDWIGETATFLPPSDGGGGRETPARPVVFCYVARGCRPCEQLKRDVRDNTDFDWRFVSESEWPAWVEWKGKPVTHWQGADGWKQRSGWTGLGDWLRAWGATQAAPMPLSDSPAVTARPEYSGPPVVSHATAGGFQNTRRSGLYYRGQTQWSWPGDLRSHLVGTHGLSWATVNGWSDGQVMAYHNRDHNGGFQAGPRRQERRGLLTRMFGG